MAYISAGNLDATKNLQPVRYLETDDPNRPLLPGIGLCLSGGGYRAMLFHLGAIWRLNELGMLRKEILVNKAPPATGPQRLVRISSVSGGSITAGLLGLKWKSLNFDSANVAMMSRANGHEASQYHLKIINATEMPGAIEFQSYANIVQEN